MDDGLVQHAKIAKSFREDCLNPYCCGRWSRTPPKSTVRSRLRQVVLILDIVEDGLILLGATITFTRNFQPVLILIVVDDGLVQYELPKDIYDAGV